ncbi:protein translocase subunit SecD [Endozoicomonas numazuensis]|uniref:Protein translocase subunit SecD n=1 Tax=Endozoicomonas numazuensis TaxID=1137799 RepID=A0A081N0Y9_9GAMM|nr:protein translocase subunit SecD [Endozoicomonas numazuensis]KEQ12112.1 preprotein translocase subunit SecD [Endozoicomonas numazuensis]
MLNRYPLWKYLLIAMIVALGFVYALPNLYPDDPAIQISGASSSETITAGVQAKAQKALDAANIEAKASDTENNALLIRLKHADQQQLAKSVIKDALGDDYIVAINLAPTTPDWLTSIGAYPMKLGLDLSGGVHFQLEVDTDRAVKTKLDISNTEIRALLRKERLRYRTMPDRTDGARQLAFLDEATRDKAERRIKREFPDLLVETEDLGERYVVSYRYSEQYIRELEDYAVKQNLTTVRNRVNELGVSEPLVQRQGRNNIVVELPGVQDTAEAKRILGKTANLEFRLEALANASRSNTESFDYRGRSVNLERDIIITGERVSSAQSNFDTESGQPQVNISLDSTGGKKMNNATRNNIGRSMAVIFIEQKPVTRTETREVDGEKVKVKVPGFREERRVISLATVQSALGNQFRITGLDSSGEASELALLLRAGSLAAPMYFVEERTVGPSLGAENIKMGVDSTLMGLGMVVMFMMVVYRVFGLLANIALAINLMLLTAAMSIFGATLTMPGIAGIVLTLGMAVDANVLVFSRIREEIKLGRPVQRAIHDGYDRAFVSIFDGNITTLLVGLILFAVGTGPIKGFAVTLSIGIVTSMFTAIMVTRSLVNLVYGGRRDLKKLSI